MPIRAKRILWPTDFSELSLHACRYVAAFREEFDSEIHVIHVMAVPMQFGSESTMPVEVPLPRANPEFLTSARESLGQLVDEHFGTRAGIVIDAFYGNAWKGVCDYAKAHEIELIVTGTHGRTGIPHVLIGSTAERIVQHAPCPVLTVKNPGTDFASMQQEIPGA